MTVKFTDEHEWIRMEGEIAVIGITQHAAQQLGDVVFVELPDAGASFEKGGEMAVVESVKAASDVYAPVTGEIVEVNETLNDAPETVSDAPEGEGWFVKIKLSNADELEGLMDEAAYKAFCEG